MIAELAKFADGIIENIESWAHSGQETVESGIRPSDGTVPQLILNIALGGDIEKFNQRLSEIERDFVPA